MTAMQMLAGGALLAVAGSLLGEWPVLLGRPIAPRSVAAFFYLSTVGGLIGFTTYAWLLRVASPTAVTTYAYVNPLVAVLLGWLIAEEIQDPSILLAAGLIIGAVVLITLPRTLFRKSVEKKPAPVENEPLRGQLRLRRSGETLVRRIVICSCELHEQAGKLHGRLRSEPQQKFTTEEAKTFQPRITRISRIRKPGKQANAWRLCFYPCYPCYPWFSSSPDRGRSSPARQLNRPFPSLRLRGFA